MLLHIFRLLCNDYKLYGRRNECFDSRGKAVRINNAYLQLSIDFHTLPNLCAYHIVCITLHTFSLPQSGPKLAPKTYVQIMQ